MPRDLPIGNGRLLLAFDRTYTLRDVYFPRVGQENHAQGRLNRFGIWCDGEFAWFSDEGWQRDLRYEERTLVTDVRLHHPRLGLTLVCHDAVALEHDLWIRRVTVRNERPIPRTVRLFLHFDGYLWGYADGETVYYEPTARALVHYKGKRYFWFSGWAGDRPGYHCFACGNKAFRGHEGTWRDAEDGVLSGNPIAQGSVDSIGGLELVLPAGGEGKATFWMAAGLRFADVYRLHQTVLQLGPEALLTRVRRYWQSWIEPDPPGLVSLSPTLQRLYRQSLLILRTQIDEGGAILAANDSDILQFGRDTYSYVWPRDGALIASALLDAGYPELARRFFTFIGDLVTHYGFFLHKYNPDGSAGSSWHPWAGPTGDLQFPIQEDSTALVLMTLWDYYRKTRDLELLRGLYSSVVVPCGRFLASYRDPVTGLPAPSYDLWEERRGIHTFTVAAVVAGLRAAARFARIFGDDQFAEGWDRAADGIRAAASRYLFRTELGRFARMLTVDAQGNVEPDPTIDASLAGLFLFGLFPARDPRVVATMQAVEERLWVKTPVGGIARYEDDYYYQMSRDIERIPGNPWFICTLWLADWHIARATSPAELARAQELLEWVAAHALPSGVLAEQVHPETGEPLSVSPLSWSHGTFIATVLRYLEREGQLAAAGWPSFLAP